MESIVHVRIAIFVAAMIPVPIAAASPVDAQWSQLAAIPVGTAPGELAYLTQVEGANARGPQALALAPTGDLYVLDSVNRRVLVIARDGDRRTINTPSSLYARDILVTDRAMYLLDDDNRILELDLGGGLRRTVLLPSGMPTHEVFRLVEAPGGAITVWAGGYQVFNVDALPQQVDLEGPLLAKAQAPALGRGVLSPGRAALAGGIERPDLWASRYRRARRQSRHSRDIRLRANHRLRSGWAGACLVGRPIRERRPHRSRTLRASIRRRRPYDRRSSSPVRTLRYRSKADGRGGS